MVLCTWSHPTCQMSCGLGGLGALHTDYPTRPLANGSAVKQAAVEPPGDSGQQAGLGELVRTSETILVIRQMRKPWPGDGLRLVTDLTLGDRANQKAVTVALRPVLSAAPRPHHVVSLFMEHLCVRGLLHIQPLGSPHLSYPEGILSFFFFFLQMWTCRFRGFPFVGREWAGSHHTPLPEDSF